MNAPLDTMAAIAAESTVRHLVNSISGATAVLDAFDAHYEYRDGVRRLVLTGRWEVNPSAVRGATT